MVNELPTDWSTAVARHAASANAFAETARSVPPETWTTPVGEGKWTPAQITEHLNRTYETVLDELRGKSGIRIRSPWLLRQLLRQTVLRSIYKNRELPRGAKAPSEILPKTVTGTQDNLVRRFAGLAEEFGEEVLANRGQDNRKLTHHVFGEIALLPGIDFIAIHIEHHHRQILR